MKNWNHQSKQYCGELSNSWDFVFHIEEPILLFSPYFKIRVSSLWVIVWVTGHSRHRVLNSCISKHKFPLVTIFIDIVYF